MNTMQFKASQKGFAGFNLTQIFELLVYFLAPTLIIMRFIDKICDKYHTDNVIQVLNLDWSQPRLGGGEEVFVLVGSLAVPILVIFVINRVFNLVRANWLWARSVYTVDRDERGWYIEEIYYEFLNTQCIYRRYFDRITYADHEQGIWDRRFGVGDVTMTLVTFVSGDTNYHTVSLMGIRNPEAVKDMILDKLPGHEGLLVSAKLDELAGEE